MTKTRKTVWAFDPMWTRVEHLDDEGKPLGYVTFERRVNPSTPQPPPNLARMLASATMRACFGLAAILRHRETARQ